MQAGAVERFEALEELSQLFGVVQAMGLRLADETHGASYDDVRDLNEILHQARKKIDLIQTDMFGMSRVLMERRATGRRTSDRQLS
jgi:hypothetical protein